MAVLTMLMMTAIVMFASFSLLSLFLSSTFSAVVLLLAIHYYCTHCTYTHNTYIPLQNIRFVSTYVPLVFMIKMATSFGLMDRLIPIGIPIPSMHSFLFLSFAVITPTTKPKVRLIA